MDFLGGQNPLKMVGNPIFLRHLKETEYSKQCWSQLFRDTHWILLAPYLSTKIISRTSCLSFLVMDIVKNLSVPYKMLVQKSVRIIDVNTQTKAHSNHCPKKWYKRQSTGWWLNHPSEKYARRKFQKYLSCHHLESGKQDLHGNP